MARRSRLQRQEPATPPWLITFSDFMTLMLAFFVMLTAMSAVDARRQRTVLGSLAEGFGLADGRMNPLAVRDEPSANEPGPMDRLEENEPLRDRPFDDAGDVRLAENRLVRIVSMAAAALFEPGGTELSGRGREILARLVPLINASGRPVLLAGHAGEPRDELGAPLAGTSSAAMSPVWDISLKRALAVRQGLVEVGADPLKLRVEAFGDGHPRFATGTAQGRRLNRRVDLVFDRDGPAIPEAQPETPPTMDFRGFRFDVGTAAGQDVTPAAPPVPQGPPAPDGLAAKAVDTPGSRGR